MYNMKEYLTDLYSTNRMLMNYTHIFSSPWIRTFRSGAIENIGYYVIGSKF